MLMPMETLLNIAQGQKIAQIVRNGSKAQNSEISKD